MRAALVDAIGDMGLGILLAEGTRILWANEAYERLTGYALAELTSADFDPMLLVPEETHETVARRMSDRAHGFRQQERAEHVLRRKDGSFVRVEAIIRTIAPGPPPRTVSLLHVQRG